MHFLPAVMLSYHLGLLFLWVLSFLALPTPRRNREPDLAWVVTPSAEVFRCFVGRSSSLPSEGDDFLFTPASF
jgi:hypothetical protein